MRVGNGQVVLPKPAFEWTPRSWLVPVSKILIPEPGPLYQEPGLAARVVRAGTLVRRVPYLAREPRCVARAFFVRIREHRRVPQGPNGNWVSYLFACHRATGSVRAENSPGVSEGAKRYAGSRHEAAI